VPERIAYKGIMLEDVPNAAVSIGYTNASWTLKCDLIAHYVCRLLNYLREHDHEIATPLPPGPSVPTEPFIDFNAGYVLRAIELLPKQGPTSPWRLHQNWFRDVRLLRHGPVDDSMEFSSRAPRRQPLEQAA